jgi:mannose-6-phosphate isomerase-like protein (cupin superfamily)
MIMNQAAEFINSGILEIYAMGAANVEEQALVEKMLQSSPKVKEEFDRIEKALETYALAHAHPPHGSSKAFLMATIDYTERIKQGEVPAEPVELHPGSRISDYAAWLNRQDLAELPSGFDDLHARLIGYTEKMVTAIVWMRSMAPQETHTDEYEKFLILEGSCDVSIGTDIHSLVPGDYISIPLHVSHHIKVTSLQPCKVILQRVAA